jgi:acetyl-CoA decarbonylase/synthase complex subunit gamma
MLTWADRMGSVKARWQIGRMRYKVDPGLYALGNPDATSPVFVTASYKMSFDRLRSALPKTDGWILVLDTNGINVWCAAGKGTLGTDELVSRVVSSGLDRLVSHRRLILPQLAGPGVAAHEVKKRCEFGVVYGPVRAEDIPAFVENGLKATSGMRVKTFDTWERIVLIPVELVEALKAALVVLPALFLLGGLGGPATFWSNAFNYGAFAAFAALCAILAGAVLTPLLLPWVPGRAFSVKGFLLGLVTAAVLASLRWHMAGSLPGQIEILSWFFLVPALSGYLGMNFTGASTYTSLSGVKREMRWAVPLEIIGGIVGLGLWLGSRFLA